MRSVSGVGRFAAIGGVIAAIVLVGIVLFGGSSAYTVNAHFINAGQLVRGNPVQSGGVPIGSVSDGLVEAWVTTYTAIAAGEMDVLSTAVPDITGHPATSLEQLLRAA